MTEGSFPVPGWPVGLRRRLSDGGYGLMVGWEVAGGDVSRAMRSYYAQRLDRPSWPGYQSGVTVGIGYDLGYHTGKEIREDWGGVGGLDADDVAFLVGASGRTGAACKVLAARMGDVHVDWAAACRVFNDCFLPKYIRATLRAFPQAADRLSADGFGGLVSLVSNRGESLEGPRRVGMREIARLLADVSIPDERLPGLIAQVILDMIPLWRGTSIAEGMRRRRIDEATLIAGGGGR